MGSLVERTIRASWYLLVGRAERVFSGGEKQLVVGPEGGCDAEENEEEDEGDQTLKHSLCPRGRGGGEGEGQAGGTEAGAAVDWTVEAEEEAGGGRRGGGRASILLAFSLECIGMTPAGSSHPSVLMLSNEQRGERS